MTPSSWVLLLVFIVTFNQGRPWKMWGPMLFSENTAVLYVPEQPRVDTSGAGPLSARSNWEQLIQLA